MDAEVIMPDKVVNIETSEQPSLDAALKHPGLNLLGSLVYVVRWFSIERVLGISMLIFAGFLAIQPLVDTSIVKVFVSITGINIFIVSNWYLLAGLFLIWKGPDTSFLQLLVCVIPMLLLTIANVILSTDVRSAVRLDMTAIAREILINGILIQRLISKLTVELLEKFSDTQLTK
jgi:hypothetical protein